MKNINFKPFKKIKKNIGIYPIVDSLFWLVRILDIGIKNIQLRIKDKNINYIEKKIEAAIILGKKYKANIFINDYWKIAIKHKAYGVHLGQKDILDANIKLINSNNLRLGISTHNEQDINLALLIKPSYIAFGHIFPTKTKYMQSTPQGLKQLKYLANKFNFIPNVAIGGISLKNAKDVMKCGVGGISVISAIKNAPNWRDTVNKFKEIVN